MSEDRQTQVAVIGGMFSGNKGAASMLQAVIDNLPEKIGPCKIHVLTVYPEERGKVDPAPNVSIVPCTAPALLFPMFPLSLVAGLLRVLSLPYRFLCVHPAMRALSHADIVVDIAGISFADGRGTAILGYNFLMAAVPALLCPTVVKCSQALGPFRTPLNRFLAKLVLPKMKAVCARGKKTEEHLHELGLKNIVPTTDIAFCMKVPEDVQRRMDDLVDGKTNRRNFVGLAPSSVVDNYCRSIGIDYPEVLAAFVDRIVTEHDMPVLVFPHSTRPSRKESRLNDIPVCRSTFERVSRRNMCTLIDEDYSPTELRAIIGRCDVLVTSRFHAMISAIATETPVMVVGWSHKYAEVLDEVGMPDYVINYEDLSPTRLGEVFSTLVESETEVRNMIRQGLENLIADAARNFDVIAQALR